MTRIAKLNDALDKIQDLKAKRAEADAFMKRVGKHLNEHSRPTYTQIVAHQAESRKLIEQLEFQLAYELSLAKAGLKLAYVLFQYGVTVGGQYYVNRVKTLDDNEHSIEHVPMPAHMLSK